MAYRKACHRGLFLFDRILEKTVFKKPTNKKSSLILKNLQAERKVAQKDRHSGGRVRKDICRVIQ